MPPGSRCALIPLPGVDAIIPPPPTAWALAACFSSTSYRNVSTNDVPTYVGVASQRSGRTFDLAPSAAERRDRADFLPPHDRLLRQRLEEEVAQIATTHFGAPPLPVVRLVEQDRALRIEDAVGLAPLVDEREERLVEAGVLEGELAVVVVDVEHPP